MQFPLQFASVPLQGDPEAFEMDPTILVVSFLIGLLITIGVGYWVYKDASKRDNNELLWAIGVAGLFFLTLFGGIIALVAYVIVRGDVVEEAPTGTDVTGDSWDSDTTQSDTDDTEW